MVKYSRYNSILPLGEEWALYNSFTQSVIFLKPELKDLLEAAIREGVEKLSEFHPSFFQYLQAKSYLVDELVDELGQVKEFGRKTDENEKEFILTVNPTMNCNFKCWYCYETHIKDSKLGIAGIEKINKLIDNVLSKEKLERFSISMFGGEPLLYFEKSIIPILDHYIKGCGLKQIRPEIGFTTNGFLIDTKFVEYFKNKGIKCGFQITLDGNRDDHNKVRFVNAKTGSFDKIVENIHLLVSNEFDVRVRINYTNEKIEGIKDIITAFCDIPSEKKDRFLIFDFHRVWQEEASESGESQIQKLVTLFREKELTVQVQGSIDNLRHSCYADKRNSVTVNYNGDIYKCTARDFTKKNREGYLDENGNLVWENGSLETRLSSKFQNIPCQSCRILPICGGGCSQVALENSGKDYCVFDFDEKKKDDIILQKVAEIRANYYRTKKELQIQ